MKDYKKLWIILVLVMLLPALFFSVYELGSLNKNEEILEEIYNNQLDVILTSVNQYSDDYAESWASVLNNYLLNEENPQNSILNFISVNPSVKGFFFTRDSSFSKLNMFWKDDEQNIPKYQYFISKQLKANNDKIKKLFKYFIMAPRYRKIEPIGSPDLQGVSFFIFLSKDFTGTPVVSGLVIDTRDFVNHVLAPKIELMIKEKFIVDIRRGNKSVYSSEKLSGAPSLQKTLWLLPDLKLGIAYKGKSLQQYVRERTYLNFGLILLIDFMFIIGTWFVFRSFKTELQLAKMRSDFISNVSHEIRTPLALLSVYTETILLGRYKPEKLNEYHQIINQETNRLTTIVNKILNFSKIEEKKYQYNFSLLSVNDLVNFVLERFSYHVKNMGFEINIDLAPDLPEINADKEALIEVLTNLIDNAIKYSETTKYIGIKTYQESNSIMLVITDKGIGIKEEQQKYIFEKFYRGSESEIHNIKGSGLGLAIVKHIIEGHKGTIKVESVPEKGSTFKISIPINKEK